MFSSYKKSYIVDLMSMKGLNYTITKYKEYICSCSYLYHVELCSLEVDSTKELLREKLEMPSSYERFQLVDLLFMKGFNYTVHEV